MEVENTRVCPECGTINESSANSCKYCGYVFGEYTVCSECGTECPPEYSECPSCGAVLRVNDNKHAISNVRKITYQQRKYLAYAMMAVAFLMAIISFKVRFLGNYDYYSKVIYDYENNKREYMDLRNENQMESDSYKGGLFKYGYQDIANGYQGLMDDADERIGYYEGLKGRIVIKSTFFCAFAVVLFIVAIKMIRMGEDKNGINKVS